MDKLQAGFAVFPFWSRLLGLLFLLVIIVGLAYKSYEAKRAAGETMLAAIMGIVTDALFGGITFIVSLFKKST